MAVASVDICITNNPHNPQSPYNIQTQEARVAVASVDIRVTEEFVPTVVITSNIQNNRHDPDTSLQLKAFATDPMTSDFMYEWHVMSKNFDLSRQDGLATTPTSKNLVIKPSVLLPGTSYVFRVDVYKQNRRSNATAATETVPGQAFITGMCKPPHCTPPPYSANYALHSVFL